jgi:CDP-diacylglycerol--serine O-phosphatidyltransferase
VGVAILMISRLRYRSFKDFDLRNRRSYLYVFPLAGILVAVLTLPEVTLLGISAAYLLSGPAGYVWVAITRGGSGRAPETVPVGEVLDEPSVR